MYFIVNVEDLCFFHKLKKTVKQTCTISEQVPPETLYTLIMDGLPTDEATSAWTTQWMFQRVRSNSNILSTFVSTYTHRKSKALNTIDEAIKNSLLKAIYTRPVNWFRSRLELNWIMCKHANSAWNPACVIHIRHVV